MDYQQLRANSTTADSCLVSKAMLAFVQAAPPQTFTFQLNPSTLHLCAEGGSWNSVVGRVKPERAQRVEAREVSTKISLSFHAYFDAMEKAEAFISDKYALYAWTNAAKAVHKSCENTVRPIVEGLLGAIRNNNNRVVLFQWGQMRHIGYLDKINCKYTMFSPKGEPIRAEAEFSITACGASVELWKEKYDTIMNQSAVKSTDMQNAVGNLLNLQ